MEEAHLQELRKSREVTMQKEEIRYLRNLLEEQERNIHSLGEEIVQQNMVSNEREKSASLFGTFVPDFLWSKIQEERQLAWDQRELELERQLDQHEKHQELQGGTEKVLFEAFFHVLFFHSKMSYSW